MAQSKRLNKKPITGTMEKTPISNERAFYKVMRGPFRKASIAEAFNAVVRRKPRPDEYMGIHPHNHSLGERQIILPNFYDIMSSFGMRADSKGKMNVDVIAVRVNKEVVGYTFLSLNKLPKKKKELEELWPNISHPLTMEEFTKLKPRENAKDFKKAVEYMKELGLKLRFVPNRKAGYVFKGGQFVKKN
ncbi:MAG: hypothetical protein ABID38_01395 [Candidatus Diapherotrites archaeon]